MDPVTHAALGACVGIAAAGHRFGRGRAAACGALAGLLPDADVVAGLAGPYADWLFHRGITHSLLLAPALALLLGAATAAVERRRAGLKPQPWAWAGLYLAALVTHALNDLFTHYGTQLLAPLSRTRFAIPALPVIDPVYTLLLAAGLAAAWRRPAAARAATAAALYAVLAYSFGGWAMNQATERAATEQLAGRGIAVEVAAYPTLLQPYLRRVVARTGDATILIGFHSLLAPRPIAWSSHQAEDASPALVALKSTPEAAILDWFAAGRVYWRARRDGAEQVVEGFDTRYGLPGDLGLWGIRAYWRNGCLVTPPTIFHDGPPASLATAARLWRTLLGRD